MPVDAFGVTRPDKSVEHIGNHVKFGGCCFQSFAIDAAAVERLRSSEHRSHGGFCDVDTVSVRPDLLPVALVRLLVCAGCELLRYKRGNVNVQSQAIHDRESRRFIEVFDVHCDDGRRIPNRLATGQVCSGQ